MRVRRKWKEGESERQAERMRVRERERGGRREGERMDRSSVAVRGTSSMRRFCKENTFEREHVL